MSAGLVAYICVVVALWPIVAMAFVRSMKAPYDFDDYLVGALIGVAGAGAWPVAVPLMALTYLLRLIDRVVPQRCREGVS